MKRILLLSILALLFVGAKGQPLNQINTTITKGYGNFTIDGKKYPLGSIIMNVRSNDTSIIELDYLYHNGMVSVIASAKKRVKYINGTTGLPFPSITAFRNFYDTFMVQQPSSGSGGSTTLNEHQIAIGSASNTMTGSDSFQYDVPSGSMTIGGVDFKVFMPYNGEYPFQSHADFVNNYTQVGMTGNTLYLGNDGVVLSSSASNIDLRPDGIASVWGSQIVTAANISSQPLLTEHNIAFGSVDNTITNSSNLSWDGSNFNVVGSATISNGLTVNGIVTQGLAVQINPALTVASYTTQPTDCVIPMNSTTRNQTVFLSSATPGQVFIVKKTAGSNTLTVSPVSGTIDGSASTTVTTTKWFGWNGTNWWVLTP